MVTKNAVTSPPEIGSAPLVHKVCEFYKVIYLETGKIPKRDRYGIFAKIEDICLEIVNLVLNAALEAKANKQPLLNTARIKIEILKRLIRISHELRIIDQSKYLKFEASLQEISKMANGWIKYLNQ